MPPRQAATNEPNQNVTNAESSCELDRRNLGMGSDSPHVIVGQLGVSVALAPPLPEYPGLVELVGAQRDPLQIHCAAISFDAVDVVAGQAARARTNEGLKDDPVNVDGLLARSVYKAKDNTGIAILRESGAHDLPERRVANTECPDSSKVADFVSFLKAKDREPTFRGRIFDSHSRLRIGALVRAPAGVCAPGGSSNFKEHTTMNLGTIGV